MAKVLISLDDALLGRVDRTARVRGLTRSAYLAQLASRDTSRALGAGHDPAVRAALATLDRILAGASADEDSTAAIRAERDLR